MWISRALVYTAVAYTALSTVDVQVASIPLKLFIVMPALGLWAIQNRLWRSRRDFAFGWSVVIVAVAVPVLWFALAALLHRQHDPAQHGTLRYAAQEASRFVYLLLYFPIVAEMRRRGSGWSRSQIWLWPVVALALLAWGLLIASGVFGANYHHAVTIGPFQGAIGPDLTGTFRVFLVSDVLLIPSFAWLFADILTRGLTRSGAGIGALLLSATYLAHTRGIWLGVCVVCATSAFALWPGRMHARARRGVALTGAAGLLALLLINADPGFLRSTIDALTGGHELSLSNRLQQAPELLAGLSREPVLGSGLGATLPSGYTRSVSAPWSFELEYLQLLFDVGVVGTLLIAMPMAQALVRASSALRRTGRSGDPRLLAGLGASAGLTIAAASNPYLISSVGMLCFAIVLALVETAVAESPGMAVAPERTAWAAWAVRPVQLGSRRIGASTAFVVSAICIAALTISEFVRPRQATAEISGRSQVVATLRTVPRGTLWLATTWGQTRPATAFIVAIGAGRMSVIPVMLGDARAQAPAAINAGPSPPGPILGLSVGVWRGSQALFVVSQAGAFADEEAVALDGSGRVLARDRTATGRVRNGTIRNASINEGLRGQPSLFLVDRSGGNVSVRVFAPFPTARQLTAAARLALPSLARPIWQPLFAPVNSRGADLAFVSTDKTAGGQGMQIHVLKLDAGFRQFGEQRSLPIALPVDPRLLAIGHAQGASLLILLNARTRQLIAVGL
jgi:O-Antigen ligase